MELANNTKVITVTDISFLVPGTAIRFNIPAGTTGSVYYNFPGCVVFQEYGPVQIDNSKFKIV